VAAPPRPVVGAAVDQVGCRYTPHVQAVTVGTALEVLNNDAVLHNVHGTLDGGGSPLTVFNVAMPFKGGKSPQVLQRRGPIKLRCDAGHTWMNAYVYVFDHPYYAVTDGKGRFAIKDVPAGKYTVEYWHEPVADKQPPVVRSATVEVADGKTASADAIVTFP
jgi:plastocyanin